MNEIVNKAAFKHENLVVGGDSNIDFNNSSSDKIIWGNFCDLFNLTDLFPSETCFMKDSEPIIDLKK